MDSTKTKIMKLGIVCVICIGSVTGIALLVEKFF